MATSELVQSLKSMDDSLQDEKTSLLSSVTNSLSGEEDNSTDGWIGIINKKVAKSKRNINRYSYADYNELGIDGKNPKKKRDKDGLVDYDKEFSNELRILKSMEVQQTKFVDDLTEQYKNMMSSKSSARGVTKYMTDLIGSITDARTTNINIIKEIIATKKIIAELSIKEREKLLKDSLSNDQENINAYANSFMKELFRTGRSNIVNADVSGVDDDYEEYDSEDIYRDIIDVTGDTIMSDEDKERELFLKYENVDVEISVIYHDNTGEWEFVAYDDEGNELSDYPLPSKCKINIDRVNGTAVDEYGQRYNLIIQ